MLKRIPTIIRWLLTLLILYGAYTETGIWTTLALFLWAVSSELNSMAIVKNAESKAGK